MDIQETLELYCENEMQKLKQICNPMINKIGGISDKDYDDFYSIALSVLSDTAVRFNPKKEVDFECFYPQKKMQYFLLFARLLHKCKNLHHQRRKFYQAIYCNFFAKIQ